MMGLGMLTKITRNGNSSLKFLRSNSNTFHQHSISEYSAISRSQLWKICSPNGVVSGTMIQKGFHRSAVVGRRFFSNALWKGRPNIPVTIRNTRFYNSFKSLDSGRKSSFKRFATDGVTISLIVVNSAVFLLWRVADSEFMVNNFMISLDGFKSGQLHTLITSGLSYDNTFHFVTSMIGLYLFGTTIGRTLGPEFLLMLYLSGAIAGSLFYLGFHAFVDPSFQNDQGVSYSKIPAKGATGAMAPIVFLGIFARLKANNFIVGPAVLLGICLMVNDIWRVKEGDILVSPFAYLGLSQLLGKEFHTWVKWLADKMSFDSFKVC